MELSEAASLCRAEMARFRECLGWHQIWTTSHKRLGETQHHHRRLGLSIPFTENSNPAQVLETIRHEIAHILAGADAGHGAEWEAACVITGARPEECADHNTSGHVWIGVCNCTWGKYNAPRIRKRLRPPAPVVFCRSCDTIIVWTHLRNGEPVP